MTKNEVRAMEMALNTLLPDIFSRFDVRPLSGWNGMAQICTEMDVGGRIVREVVLVGADSASARDAKIELLCRWRGHFGLRPPLPSAYRNLPINVEDGE